MTIVFLLLLLAVHRSHGIFDYNIQFEAHLNEDNFPTVRDFIDFLRASLLIFLPCFFYREIQFQTKV